MEVSDIFGIGNYGANVFANDRWIKWQKFPTLQETVDFAKQ
jgi:hypothetical protein